MFLFFYIYLHSTLKIIKKGLELGAICLNVHIPKKVQAINKYIFKSNHTKEVHFDQETSATKNILHTNPDELCI